MAVLTRMSCSPVAAKATRCLCGTFSLFNCYMFIPLFLQDPRIWLFPPRHPEEEAARDGSQGPLQQMQQVVIDINPSSTGQQWSPRRTISVLSVCSSKTSTRSLRTPCSRESPTQKNSGSDGVTRTVPPANMLLGSLLLAAPVQFPAEASQESRGDPENSLSFSLGPFPKAPP